MTGLPPLLGLHVECCSVNWECWPWFLSIYCPQWNSCHLIWKFLHSILQYIP
jgi:hypothetical protein